ncbi:hypothetical protein, partial [Brevundimonas sp. SPF441]|uniref:hypothetical protein n=1 Tax=Brevundimonas sp. SPF441 TaxID=2663795 RepID=UPI00129E09B5
MTATQAPTPGPLSGTLTDPMERMVAEAFEAAGIGFKTNTASGLDFAIDGAPVFVEVKQFHTPRIAGQMARVDNVVAIQGRQAMSWFSSLVRRLAATAPVEASGSEIDERTGHPTRYSHRPQPSGETRPTDEEIRSAIKATEYKYFGDYEFTEDQHTAVDILVRAAQVLLSTSPLALGGQQGEASVRDMRLSHWAEVEPFPARAEAQDEGAAGVPVAFEIVSYDIYPGACWIAPSAADEYRKEYGCTLRPLYAH